MLESKYVLTIFLLNFFKQKFMPEGVPVAVWNVFLRLLVYWPEGVSLVLPEGVSMFFTEGVLVVFRHSARGRRHSAVQLINRGRLLL